MQPAYYQQDKELGQMIRSTFVSHFEKWLNLTQVKNFTCFFKDNSIIVRLFEFFFIPLSMIRCISYQEMKIIVNDKQVNIFTKEDERLR